MNILQSDQQAATPMAVGCTSLTVSVLERPSVLTPRTSSDNLHLLGCDTLGGAIGAHTDGQRTYSKHAATSWDICYSANWHSLEGLRLAYCLHTIHVIHITYDTLHIGIVHVTCSTHYL